MQIWAVTKVKVAQQTIKSEEVFRWLGIITGQDEIGHVSALSLVHPLPPLS